MPEHSLPLTGELGPDADQPDRSPGVKRSSTVSAAASSAAVSDVGSGRVMLRVFVVNGAKRTLTPTRAAGLPSARTSSATRRASVAAAA